MSGEAKKPEKLLVASNRKARHDYEILEVLEAGLSLKGPEVKSVRERSVRLEGSFARVENGQLVVHNLHISPYKHNTLEEIAPDRDRRLLMHRREIAKLRSQQEIKGLALVPLELYFLRGWAKVALAVAKGRRGPDKRQAIKERESERELRKSFKGKF
ncbi:MAG: SsrA-binding protein SmpB [Elusimicrobiota bacterium]